MSLDHPLNPTAEEMTTTEEWIALNLGRETSDPAFSFKYGDRSSVDFLKECEIEDSSEELDEHLSRRTITYTDPQTGLELRCVVIEYNDFPVVEWTLYFKNTGSSDTPILSDIRALDIALDFAAEENADDIVLHHFAGGFAEASAYQPFQTVMGPGTSKRFSGAGGRPTNSDMSYFNIEGGKDEGVILVVGWPGQWSADFGCSSDGTLHVTAGQELTHFTLRPQEEVRTPLMALLFWKGRNWIDSQNVWRRWMMKHSMPKPYGKLPEPRVLGSSYRVYGEMVNATEENQIMFIDRYIEENIKLEYWWMDAGWYPCDGGWGTWVHGR